MNKYIEILYERQKKIIKQKKYEETRIYSGREKELEFIENIVLQPRSKSKPVLNIHGPASIGKTRLLKQFRENQEKKLSAKYIAYLDFFINFHLRNKQISLLNKIANDWDASQSLFTRFRSNNMKLKKIINKNGEKFKEICRKEEVLRKSEAVTANKIINMKLVEELIRHNFEPEEVNFILNYSQIQKEEFLHDVNNIYNHEGGRRYENFIILDDFDLCGPSIVSLVREMIERSGNKILFIIATKEPLSWGEESENGKEFSDIIEYLPLKKYDHDKIVEYLFKKEIYDKDIQNLVIDISSGYPFLMETTLKAVELLKENNMMLTSKEVVRFFNPPVDELNDEIQITTYLMKKINEIFTMRDRRLKDLLYRIAIPRFFNEEVVFLIAEYDDEKIADFFVGLAGMVFVTSGYREDGSWKYHDLVRKVCLKLCEKDEEHNYEIHGKLYQYFKKDHILESIHHLYKLKPLETMGMIINLYNDNLQSLKIQKARNVLNDFFSYFTEVSDDTEIEEKGLIYSSLANMFLNLPGTGHGDNIKNAIIAYKTALDIYDEKNNTVSYGSTLRCLGDAYSEVFNYSTDKIEAEKFLKKAINYYQEAIKFFPLDLFPVKYAELKSREGLILTKFHEPKIEDLKNAISYLEESLEIFKNKKMNLDFAKNKKELGNIFVKVAHVEESSINLKMALSAYKEAIAIFEKENLQVPAGEVWKSMGIAYYEIEQDRSVNLHYALEAFQKALAVFGRERFTEQFVEIKKYIGLCYYYLYDGDISINVENAWINFKDALEAVDQERNPLLFADLCLNLGNAYGRLRLGDRSQNLEQSLSLYSQALKIYKQDRYPMQYAELLNNQGMVFLELPSGNHRDNINKAIKLFKEALKIRTKDSSPENYAATQMNLGSSYQELMVEGKKYIPEAIKAYEEALQIMQPDKNPLDCAMITNNLGNIYEKVAVQAFRNKEFQIFKDAITKSLNFYEKAITIVPQKSNPQFYEIISKNLNEIKKVASKLDMKIN